MGDGICKCDIEMESAHETCYIVKSTYTPTPVFILV